MPDFHIWREPDRERIVARPLERLALGDEQVVIALRPADRPRRRLGLGGQSRKRGGPDSAEKAEAPLNELTTVVLHLAHGACPHCEKLGPFSLIQLPS